MTQSTAFKRLLASANFVRAGAVFADIGTDHGYLPIFLLKEGRIERAVLADINEGPLNSARENVKAEGLEDRCEFYLTDGASVLSGKGITDYAICGMGGELISAIISRAPHLRDRGVRLILQPMSKQSDLRLFLAKEGFAILDEGYTYADGKYYLTILAEFDGVGRELSASEALLGRMPSPDQIECYKGYIEKKLNSYVRAKEGKLKGGEDCAEETALCLAIEDRLAALGIVGEGR